MAIPEGSIVRPGVYMRYENIGGATKSTPSYTGGGGFMPPVVPDNTIDIMFYETLAAALEAVEDGGTLVISQDTAVTETVRVPEDKDITIRVPAGSTLSLDAGAENYGLVVKGGVTIEGAGDIVLTGFGFGTSMNTEGSLTIKSGHFVAQGCDYIIGCFDGEVVIEGGTFDGEYCVVNNFSEYYGTDGKVRITGGTFNTSAEDGFDVLGAPVEITGGRFSKPVAENHLAEGRTATETDGYYTVA